MSDTPETDRLAHRKPTDVGFMQWVSDLLEHAKKKERENGELREQLVKEEDRIIERILEVMTAAGIDVSGCDGEDDPASIVGHWAATQILKERESADAWKNTARALAKDFTSFKEIARENGLVGTWGNKALAALAELERTQP